MSKYNKILIGIYSVLIVIIIVLSICLVIRINNDNKVRTDETKEEKLKELPKPEVTGGVRGELGIDKNINELNIDEYLNREDAVYRDMRMLEDPGNYEAIGGDRYLSGYVKGFEIVPLPYIIPVSGLPEEVGNTYQGDTLFSINSKGKYEANYEESMSILEELFPKDKVIFLMCGGGGYAGQMKNLLVSLGWDETKIYNVGGYWYYDGDNNVEVKKEVDGKITYDFDSVPYHNIDFTKLTKIDKRVVLDSIYYNTTTNEEFDSLTKEIEKTEEAQRSSVTSEESAKYIPVFEKLYLSKANIINRLIKEKKSFIVAFDYSDSSCSNMSINPYGYVQSYARENNIYVYTANLVAFKNTELYKTVKYAPTVVIISKGEIIAYTDPNSDEFKEMYTGIPGENDKNIEAFNSWINSYVKVK